MEDQGSTINLLWPLKKLFHIILVYFLVDMLTFHNTQQLIIQIDFEEH